MRTLKIDKLSGHKVHKIKWEDHAKVAECLMAENHLRHLAVTDKSGIIVGAISRSDVAAALQESRPGFRPEARVCEFMRYPLITMPFDTQVEAAAASIIANNVAALLIADSSENAVGILTSEDLLEALVALATQPGPMERLNSSPLIQELIREAQSVGL